MKLCPFIVIILVFCWAGGLGAQVPQEPSSMPEQWQLTLDVIKSKAQSLVMENNGLQVKYQQLISQVQELQQSINEEQNQNDKMTRFLKERHGQTDQQIRIKELDQILDNKKQEIRILEPQYENLERKQADLGRKIQSLKDAIAKTGIHQQAPEEKAFPIVQNATSVQPDAQLIQLRKELEDETRQEVVLENQIGDLKNGDEAQNSNEKTINEENRLLEARLDDLRLEKQEHDQKNPDTHLAESNGQRYNKLERHKEELEADIRAYEKRLDDLRESSLVDLSWPAKKKRLVHKMVQTDARNNQMRDKIKELREDIEVLKDQVARLERRVDFAQGKDPK